MYLMSITTNTIKNHINTRMENLEKILIKENANQNERILHAHTVSQEGESLYFPIVFF